MAKRRVTKIPVTPSSGNVFADMGMPEAEEELTKAQLASHITHVVKRRRLTQLAAARLMRLLTALGQDVDITITDGPRNRARAQGRIRVVSDAA